ncbi:MAG: N-acetyltransferase [Rhizobiales bacterium]|nr:N-acetyltransferase [Hyphomicrobiales bacterium]
MTSSDIRVTKEDGAFGGRYVARIADRAGEAEIIYSRIAADAISADHTLAPESMRGSGAAMALVEFMLADARAHGFGIVARCPYVAAQFRKHPEWGDVMRAA